MTDSKIIELIGVYDADSTLRGEISYWMGARIGRTHCSLCELTHGLFTKKNEWKECSQNLVVPFLTFHRNDAPVDVLEAAKGNFPVVLMRSPEQVEVVLNNEQLEQFNKSTSQFAEWVRNFIADELGPP